MHAAQDLFKKGASAGIPVSGHSCKSRCRCFRNFPTSQQNLWVLEDIGGNRHLQGLDPPHFPYRTSILGCHSVTNGSPKLANTNQAHAKIGGAAATSPLSGHLTQYKARTGAKRRRPTLHVKRRCSRRFREAKAQKGHLKKVYFPTIEKL